MTQVLSNNSLVFHAETLSCKTSTNQTGYEYSNNISPSINTTIILKITILVIKYGYMFRLILSHPQANIVTEFRYIKYKM